MATCSRHAMSRRAQHRTLCQRHTDWRRRRTSVLPLSRWTSCCHFCDWQGIYRPCSGVRGISGGHFSPILPLLPYLPNPPFRLPLCNFIASPLVAPLHPVYNATHTHTTVLWPFFQDHPGEPVPQEIFDTLWCKGRLIEADTQTIQLGGTPSGLASAHLHHPPFFTGRMPFLPPSQQCQSTEGN